MPKVYRMFVAMPALPALKSAPLVHVTGGAPVHVSQAWPIGHEAPGVHELALFSHHREPALGRQMDDPCPVRPGEKIPKHHERASALPGCSGEGALQLVGTAHLQGVELHPQRLGCALHLLPLEDSVAVGWVDKDSHPGDCWHGLLQKLQPFAP